MTGIMKTFSRILSLLLLCLVAASSSCGSKEGTEPDRKVEFSVPSTVTLEKGASSMDFKVLFGNAPKSSDKIVLEDGAGKSSECSITSVTSSVFTVSLPQGLQAGPYKVYFLRDGKKTLMGTVEILFEDGVSPSSGSTVYGLVSCDGKPLSGVVVSDGAEVVKTNAEGVYQLRSAKENGYVFVSIPSGYEVNVSGVIPQFFRHLSQDAKVAERVDFTLYPSGDQTKHTMLVMGDMHLAKRTNDLGQFSNFINDMNATVSSIGGKIYGLSLGDMSWDLYWKQNGFNLEHYLLAVNDVKNLPIFHTIGNHDHSMYYSGDFDTVNDYKRIIGPTNYSFNIGKVHYVVLDNILCTNTGEGTSASRQYKCTLAPDALSWLKKDLAFVDASTPVLVTMHAPQFNDAGGNRMTNAQDLTDALKKFQKAHIFTGHTHIMYNVDKSSSAQYFEHNAGAVCGTWWWTGYYSGIHVSQDGTPGGYTILTVDGSDFSWQYKATGAPVDFQFRTYDRNSIALGDSYVSKGTTANKNAFASEWSSVSRSNEVYINVWNYDPSWKIEVVEDGGKSLACTKVEVKDPLHILTYNSYVYNQNKDASPNFPTVKTKHMFKVVASDEDVDLTIKVTDRFGKVYTERMERPKPFDLNTYKLQ